MSITYNELLDNTVNQVINMIVSDGAPLHQSYWNDSDERLEEFQNVIDTCLFRHVLQAMRGNSFIALASTITGETSTLFQQAKNDIILSQDEEEEGERTHMKAICRLIEWELRSRTIDSWAQ